MLTHLLYRSFSNGDLDERTVERILEKSRANNLRDGVSGILLYKNRMFLQLLEGQDGVVQRCLSRIRADRRHYGMGIILSVRSEKRIFPYWQMGFLGNSSDLKPFDSVRAVSAAKVEHHPADRQTIVNILRMFATEEQLKAGLAV